MQIGLDRNVNYPFQYEGTIERNGESAPVRSCFVKSVVIDCLVNIVVVLRLLDPEQVDFIAVSHVAALRLFIMSGGNSNP